jgi:hypothetical protein
MASPWIEKPHVRVPAAPVDSSRRSDLRYYFHSTMSSSTLISHVLVSAGSTHFNDSIASEKNVDLKTVLIHSINATNDHIKHITLIPSSSSAGE